MCKALNEFAIENDIHTLGELCAFLYDYEISIIKEVMEEEQKKPISEQSEQAWILVGNYSEGDGHL